MSENDRVWGATAEAERKRLRAYYLANRDRIRAKTRAYAKANPEKVAAYQRAYYAEHGDKKRAYAREYSKTEKARRAASERRRRDRLGPRYMKNYNLVAKYGLTLDEYERRVAERGGRCDICKEVPTGKRHHSVLHIDHSHETNTTRGLLCGRCNTAIGLLREDQDLFVAAVAYLRSYVESGQQERGTSDLLRAS